ncbi:MAG: phage antirepressor KilAC domain-containing protein [Anaerobutyricum hallii]|uniref:phage antirepressor n=1 Tax=Anaerobutyricum hallii TaxID=39488 RepID=UPI002A80A56D|nr:phage antirepressor KilAC domain-containing protein [Anaerobutyricum hallii]MDY4579758.1 phage antirepressor KilAC domain-containing protein [Anaerobutyricum hallii]
MNDLQIFKNKEFGEIRTVQLNNETYFIGKDVTTALGYANARDAISKHVDDEDKGVAKCDTPGGKQDLTVVNESGLYALIFGSKLESAKRFKHWVTSEVIPSIRKHGMYAVDDLLNNPDMAIKAFTALKEEREKNKLLQEDVKRMKPKEIFADAVSTSHTSILIGDLAKILKQNGVQTGQKRLFEWMRENGFLIKRNGADRNMPTQRAMEQGLFEVKESTVNNPDGSVRINRTTKVTGKGQQYFINIFLSDKKAG